MRPAYYNEIDEEAAAWLRELIRRGVIAPGEVDTRSIEDVVPSDLYGFGQCHFFAGIGVWSYALRLAGVPDDLPVWTGSCPCQPFSQSGKGTGFADERHLWPAWYHIIEQLEPEIVFGEQVADKGGLVWLDLVSADMETLDYAFGEVPCPSAGFGAPHIRLRDFWVANAHGRKRDWRAILGGPQRDGQDAGWPEGLGIAEPRREVRGLGHADGEGSQGRPGMPERAGERPAGTAGVAGGMADADGGGREPREGDEGVCAPHNAAGAAPIQSGVESSLGRGPGPTNGFWRDADWLGCRDGKWRPVEPGTFPLVDGAPARVLRLRGYGNAINAEQAAAFIEDAMTVMA